MSKINFTGTWKRAARKEDHWYWEVIQATSTKVTKNYPVTLANVSTAPGSARLRGLLRGMSASPNHRTQVLFNGNLLEDATWSSGSEYLFDISIPQSSILEGNNTISIAGVEGYNQTFLINWLEIDYYDTYTAENDFLAFDGDSSGAWKYKIGGFTANTMEVFDITNPSKPVKVLNGLITETAGQYAIEFNHTISSEAHYLGLTPTLANWHKPAAILQDTASNLRATSNQADWIVISHKDFSSQANELAQYRSSQGLSTKVVDVQDIYDEFNGGVFDPEAIHDFLAHAYASWTSPAPGYVVLLGDGHYDFKNFLATNNVVYIPPYLADVDPWYGETAADNRYVTVSGEDLLPDMHLGRLPARTAAEAQAMVDKIKSYDANLPADGWNEKALFVADNPDSGGDFHALSDSMVSQLPVDYTPDKVYYGLNYTDAAAAKQALKAAVNQGRLLVSYIGHANSGAWTSEKIYEIGGYFHIHQCRSPDLHGSDDMF